VAEQKKQGQTYLNGVNEDVNDSGANKVTASGHEGGNGQDNPYDAAIDKVFPLTGKGG
jgi:hypothetical protein